MKNLLLILMLGAVPFARAEISEKGFEIDSRETIKNVKMLSGKKDDIRLFKGRISKVFDSNIEKVLASVLDFQERCNNEYKDKRKFTDKNADCRGHNPNLIESLVVKNFDKPALSSDDVVENFLVLRRIYNRDLFHHTDLVTVSKKKNKNRRKSYSVKLRMLGDKEAKMLSKKALEKESAFLDAHNEFLLEEISDNKTEVTFVYSSSTDHWLINKSVAAGEVFESVSKSLNLLFDSVAADLK